MHEVGTNQKDEGEKYGEAPTPQKKKYGQGPNTHDNMHSHLGQVQRP